MTPRENAPGARRYTADADAVLPELPGAGGPPPEGTSPLSRTHYDLPDLALLRHGITVSLTGGADAASWDLAFPAELRHLDLTIASRRNGGVPPKLLERVRVHVRDRELRPVARLDIHRREITVPGPGGGAVLRVRDDAVAPADGGPGWREWTVGAPPTGAPARDGRTAADDAGRSGELPETVEALLVAAGASPGGPAKRLALRVEGPGTVRELPASAGTPVGAVLAPVFTALAAELKSWDPRVRVDEEDAVHQLRVKARTLRSVLRTYGKLLDEDAARDLEARLQRLGRALSAARDAEVIRGRVPESTRAYPDRTIPGHVVRLLGKTAATNYRQAYQALLAELDSPRYFRLLAALDDFTARVPLRAGADAEDARKALRRAARRQQRRVVKLIDAAAVEEDPAARISLLHEVRKRSKRLRYAIRSVSAAAGFDFGKKLEAALVTAEEVQDALGVHRDSVLFQEHVARTAREAHRSGSNTFAYGVLHQAEVPRQEAASAAYREAAERLR
ncbi:CYTH and CHAD domain-containing protein [Arthrobacter sp. TMN-37]